MGGLVERVLAGRMIGGIDDIDDLWSNPPNHQFEALTQRHC